jgi:hypothetical protein
MIKYNLNQHSYVLKTTLRFRIKLIDFLGGNTTL